MYLIVRYRVEALDCIPKDRPEDTAKDIRKSIDVAYMRLSERFLKKASYQASYQVKSSNGILNIPLKDIMFFGSHHLPHKLIVHTKNRSTEFYGVLKSIPEVNSDFYRCHKSFVVNVGNIKRVNKTNRMIELVNGAAVPVSTKKMRALIQALA